MNRKFLKQLFILTAICCSFYACNLNSEKGTNKDSTLNQDVVVEESSKEIKLNSEQLKKLNTFFSNFSEIFQESFAKNELSDNIMINFAVHHNYINYYKRFESVSNGEKAKIKENYINEIAKKFFGKEIQKQQSVTEIEYKNGFYFLAQASGEAFAFSQVEKLEDAGNGNITAYINVYTASSGWTGDVQANPKTWKSNEDGNPEFSYKVKATISLVSNKESDGNYNLVDYFKIK